MLTQSSAGGGDERAKEARSRGHIWVFLRGIDIAAVLVIPEGILPTLVAACIGFIRPTFGLFPNILL